MTRCKTSGDRNYLADRLIGCTETRAKRIATLAVAQRFSASSLEMAGKWKNGATLKVGIHKIPV